MSFTPDFVWTKGRGGDGSNPASGQQYHELHDSVRGAGKRLFSNDTAAESDVQTLKSFDSDGFTVAMGTGAQSGTNQNTTTMVGWSWKAGGSASSNSDGSITSSVSANTDAGFSITSFVGNGSAGASVGHGLGVQPSLLIIRRRDPAEAWAVWAGGGGFSNTQYLRLNATNAVDTATTLFNSTTPTSSVVTLGSGDFVNTNTKNYIMYAFASVPGYQTVGSYVGNGNANGTFVFTNFAVKWLMVKRTDGTGSWNIADAVRSPFNEVDEQLQANLSNAESTTFDFDFLSNGFKARTTDSARNASGGNYIYLAIGDSYKFSNAR